jgi:hypothetical protein
LASAPLATCQCFPPRYTVTEEVNSQHTAEQRRVSMRTDKSRERQRVESWCRLTFHTSNSLRSRVQNTSRSTTRPFLDAAPDEAAAAAADEDDDEADDDAAAELDADAAAGASDFESIAIGALVSWALTLGAAPAAPLPLAACTRGRGICQWMSCPPSRVSSARGRATKWKRNHTAAGSLLTAAAAAAAAAGASVAMERACNTQRREGGG